MSPVPGELDETWLDSMRELIARRTGLARVDLRAKRLGQFARPATGNEPAAAEDPRHWDALIDEVTVRETYFFRHPEHFDVLRKFVLPELRARRGDDAFVRVWSAGCASGEEPYSIAMVLAEEGMLERAQILGTDISRAAIESARAARYRAWSLRALEPDVLIGHFELEAERHVVRAHLTRHVKFRQLNLVEDQYPSLESETRGMQLMFCRNVLMFLDERTRMTVVGRFFEALEPGGWMFTGPSDPNLTEYAPFDAHAYPGTFLYRKPLAAKPLISSPVLAHSPLPAANSAHASARPPRVPSYRPPPKPASVVETPKPAPDHSVSAITQTWHVDGPAKALSSCTAALERNAEVLELHYLKAMLLWEMRRLPEATEAMRRVLYLDRTHVLAHFGLASIEEALGELSAARRGYRNTLSACEKQSPEAPLPQGDGLSVAGLRGAAEHGLRRLDARGGA